MKRFLVALDDSPGARDVIGAAARLAQLSGARLVLFRALDQPVPDSALDHLTDDAELSLEQLAATVPRSLIERVHIDPQPTRTWDGICRAARADDCDLIVIGSHAYKGMDHLLGTTAGKVVNHADRNVLVVRAPL